MLKITQETSGIVDVLRLEGQLAGPWVCELRRVLADWRRTTPTPFVLDLAAVTFIDAAGVALFEEISADAVFVNCSLFAAEQLKGVIARQHVRRS